MNYYSKYIFKFIVVSVLWIPLSVDAMPRYMYLPFNEDIKLQQGWNYLGGGAHNAMDFIKGTVDNSNTWVSFDVHASHKGQAKYFPNGSLTWGNYVLTKKTIASVDYYNVYAHLDDSDISDSSWQNIQIGDIIGQTGVSGAANNVNHLHYEFSETSYGPGYKLDPYDIEQERPYYPSYSSYSGCGSDYSFVVCPPLTPFINLVQGISDTEGNSVAQLAQQIGTSSAGVIRQLTFKIKWLGQTQGGTPPWLLATISCYKNLVPGNECDTSTNPSWNDPDSITADNSITLTSNTDYTNHLVTFDFTNAELLPSNYYRINLIVGSGSNIKGYGDNDDSFTGTYSACHMGCGSGAVSDLYFEIEE